MTRGREDSCAAFVLEGVPRKAALGTDWLVLSIQVRTMHLTRRGLVIKAKDIRAELLGKPLVRGDISLAGLSS